MNTVPLGHRALRPAARGSDVHEADTEVVFHAAVREGRLAECMEKNSETANAMVYRIVSELVYTRLTQPAERARGHHRCALSVDLLEPDCHDRHQDDVEAVRADLLRHAHLKIDNLPGWLVPRLKPVTVDAYRRRRGDQGAQQRPRLPLPAWLDAKLGGDRWLSTLAIEILTWVGVPNSVQIGLWPLGAWADRRAHFTGDHGNSEARVAHDVEQVLAAMQTNPGWYEKYVERPLGRKQAPPALRPDINVGSQDESLFLVLTDPGENTDARLRELAADAIEAISQRLAKGADPHSAVVEVLGSVFNGGTGAEEMDRAPGDGSHADERMATVLADPETINRIAGALLEIVKDR